MWKEKLMEPRVLITVASASSFVFGLSIGYVMTNKKLETKYQVLASQEIAEVKRHYAIRSKNGVSLDKMASQYEDMVEDLKYVSVHPLLDPVLDDGSEEAKRLIEEGQALAEKIVIADEEIAKEEEVKNIFGSDDPDIYFDYDEELKRRTEKPDEPYVITHDEYFEGALDFNQVTLTYYEGDGVLADDRDQVIEDEEGTAGSSNLLRFGHGSNDRNIVYVRNERLSIDIEILRSDGKYAKEVLGFDDELKHSDKPRLRKFRDYDE